MNRCSFCEWIPILPLPVWPLAGQCRLGQNTVVGSMPCSSWLCVEAYQEEYVGSLFSLQVSFATVKGSATARSRPSNNAKRLLLCYCTVTEHLSDTLKKCQPANEILDRF